MKKILLGLILLALAVGVGTGAKRISAATGDSMRGWLWGGSENPSDGVINGNETGLWWISTNDVDTLAASPTYGVRVPTSDGAVTGEAWYGNDSGASDWLQFNPAADNVTYPGCGYPTAPCQAVQRAGDTLVGWARFVGIANDYNKVPKNSGGWEGWVKMWNVSINTGVAPNQFVGYAWHGEQLVFGVPSGYGWIDFSRATFEAPMDLLLCPVGALVINVPNAVQILAYYGLAGTFTCLNTAGSNDVTDLVSWTSTAPAVATVGNTAGVNKGLVMAVSAGTADISSAPYLGVTPIPRQVTVNACFDPVCASYGNVTSGWCPDETRFVGVNLCDGSPLTCPGTRYCNFNVIEVPQR